MSRNGSGQYNPPASSWNPAVDGNSATTADFNALLTDLSNALTQSVSKDGQTAMTGSLSMGGNKLTGLSAGSTAGDSLRFEQLFSQGTESDLASAATVDIGGQLTNFLRITGTTTISSFGTNYNGPKFLRFAGALQLTHNATTLILPGAANITTQAGDCAIVRPVGNPATGWQVVAYQKSSGTPIGAAASGANSDITSLSAVTSIQSSTGIQLATRTDVASASTVVLTSSPDDIRITGTTTITAFTVAVGRVVRVTFGGSLTLTNNANIVTQTGANIVTQAGDTCVLRATAANTVEVLNYSRVAQPTLGTAVNTTSGTSIDFTGIPSWARRVTVMLNGVSTNGTSIIQCQLGTSSGVETTGYVAGTASVFGTTGGTSFTSGFGIRTSNDATTNYTGHMVFTLLGSNTWICSGVLYAASNQALAIQAGSKTLSGTLDRLRITTVNGTDAFDLGSANILYE